MKNRFIVEEVDCGIFSSCFIPLCLVAVLGVVKLIVSSLLKSSSPLSSVSPEEKADLNQTISKAKSQDKIKPKKSGLEKMDHYLNHAFFVYLHNSMVLDFVMGAVINLQFMPWSGLKQLFHHLASIAILGAILYLSYFLIKILVDLEIKKRDAVEGTHVKTKFKRWLFLRVPIKESARLLASFTPENYLVHDILLCIFLVVFNGKAGVQILSLLLMKAYIFFNLCTLPMKELPEQLMLTGNEFFFLGILVQFLRIHMSDSMKKDHEALESNGKILIVLYILMLSFNALIAFYAVFLSFRELCSKDKAEIEAESGLTKVIAKRRENKSRIEKKYMKKASTPFSTMDEIINNLKADAQGFKKKSSKVKHKSVRRKYNKKIKS